MKTDYPHPYIHEAGQIQELIDQCGGDSDTFVKDLHKSKIPHISFSQVYSFETCPQQYYMRYILGKEIIPIPEYFIKGKALHRTIANAYKLIRDGSDFDEEIIYYGEINRFSQSGNHLRNGYLTFCQNVIPSIEVVGIEKPFVFLLSEDIPPVVGVIDLILSRGDILILIDHKTGRDFYQPDILQMTIYQGYMRSTGFQGECEFYYDNYRWVENLARIRKPAFERKKMVISETQIRESAQRLSEGYEGIRKLWQGSLPDKRGECFRCGYRNCC
jgi:CRISPR/Cas system-associated exonuclease Cas4 (RecB family)